MLGCEIFDKEDLKASDKSDFILSYFLIKLLKSTYILILFIILISIYKISLDFVYFSLISSY